MKFVRVRYLESSLKKFIRIAIILAMFLCVIGIVLYFIYSLASVGFYNFVVEFALIAISIVFLLFIISITVVLYAYKKKCISSKLAITAAYSVKFIRPFFIFLADIFGINGEDFKNFFIDLNNIIVNSYGIKFKSEDILVILPHCLQNFDCVVKVTGDSSRCKRCGKCPLSYIITICENLNIDLEIVTGGTAARNIVMKHRPKLIVSVACERDLLSGIIDVGIIPVLGIINQRPNGPCLNTNVNIKIFEESLKRIIKL